MIFTHSCKIQTLKCWCPFEQVHLLREQLLGTTQDDFRTGGGWCSDLLQTYVLMLNYFSGGSVAGGFAGRHAE